MHSECVLSLVIRRVGVGRAGIPARVLYLGVFRIRGRVDIWILDCRRRAGARGTGVPEYVDTDN